MFLAGLALLIGTSFAWAMPSQWLTSAEEVADGYEKPGDVNGDGNVTINDVTLAVDYLIGKLPIPDDATKNRVDVNKDGNITINDITLIVDYLLGKVQ